MESNPLMKKLYNDNDSKQNNNSNSEYKHRIDALYDNYLPFYDKSKRNSLWYLFWNDVWKLNGGNVKKYSRKSKYI